MGAFELHGRDLISTQEWSVEELEFTMRFAEEIKGWYYAGHVPELFRNRTFFMLFYNTSTRTRSSFEAAATILGGHAQFIDFSTTRGAEGEAVKDTAKVYERLGHALGIRILESAVDYVYGAANSVIREYAKHSMIPVINMADDMFHPTQAMTDIMTIAEKLGDLKGKKYTIMWAYSSRIRSWGSIQDELLMATRFGMDVTLAYPPGFDLDEGIVEQAKANAIDHGGSLEITHDLASSIEGAHVVFPRSWASTRCVKTGLKDFGRENELEVHEKYRDWRLTQQLVDLMDRHGIITHVLPVFRGEEADDGVMDGPRSVIYDQAENLLYLRAAVLALVAGRPR